MHEPSPVRIELSAGGVIFRRSDSSNSEILLIKDSYGNWGFPKGHIEDGETSLEAALRESREETGLKRLRDRAALGITDWYFRTNQSLVHKYCDYFLLEAEPGAPAQAQAHEGIQDCRWFDSGAALKRITYANARHILGLALQRLESAADAARGAAPSGPSASGDGHG